MMGNELDLGQDNWKPDMNNDGLFLQAVRFMWHAQDDIGVALDCDDRLVVTLLLVWLHRAYTDCDLDPLAAQALRVIRVETLCAVERWVLKQLIVL